MFVNSIDRKKFFTRPDGVKVRDLTYSMFDLGSNNYISYNVYRVPKEYQMRPDLISKSVYNNSVHAEIILKFNGISNPFSIKEGDVILIPELDSAQQKINKTGTQEGTSKADKIRNAYKYIDPLKKPKRDPNLTDYDQRKIASTPANALPPNFSEAGTKQLTYRGGRVYFGEGAEENCLTNGMTQSEFITKVIKSRNSR